tara:strand:+ start:1217 stop:1696 length:480 start_codon:yes stop_codon:yes gene_type:complete
MSRDLNQITILGNVGVEPEIKVWDDGNKQATFSVATKISWQDKSTQEWKDKTSWHRIVVKNQYLADKAENRIQVGDRVLVQGTMEYREWMDNKTDTKRYSAEIVLGKFDGILEVQPSRKSNGEDTFNSEPSEEFNSESSEGFASRRNIEDVELNDIPFE